MQSKLPGARHLLWLVPVAFLTGCSKEPQETTNQPEQESANVSMQEIKPPVAKKVPYEMTAHGDKRVDNYYWMRDDERKDPEIIAHLEAENNYTKTMLAHTESMQEQLFNEIVSRIEKDDDSVPYKKGDYFYYDRYEADKEYPIYARKKGSLDAEEEITLDVNQLAEGKEFFVVGNLDYSPDEQLLAYAEDSLSRRIYTIRLKDLSTGKLREDVLEEASASLAFSADSQYLFYIRKDLQTLLGNRVFRHKIGTPQSEDVLVYEEQDNTLYLGLGVSDDDQTLMISRGNSTSGSVMVLDANNPTGEFQLFQPHEVFIQYDLDTIGDYYFYITNRDATNFKIYRIQKDKVGEPDAWQLVIPHREQTLIEDFELFHDYLVLVEKQDGLNNLVIYNHEGELIRNIEFKDAAYSMDLDVNVNNDSSVVRFEYSSLTTPDSIYEVDIKTGKQTLLKQDKVLGDYDPELYQSERFFVEARDGAEIPVSMVYRKDFFKRDGTSPLYQYAYGSYGYSIPPSFSSSTLSLINRGFVFAIAHIRGSSTMGRQWYEDG